MDFFFETTYIPTFLHSYITQLLTPGVPPNQECCQASAAEEEEEKVVSEEGRASEEERGENFCGLLYICVLRGLRISNVHECGSR